MADKQRTHSRKRRSRFLRFPEIAGKTIESVEIDPDVQAIAIVFNDKTVLSFDLEPMVVVFPELSDWKTGNWKGMKRWPSLRSKITIVE